MTISGAIEVIYEDRALVVVNKPAGLSVHNDSGNLIERLVAERGERLRPVHRLDRETSGLLLLARAREAAGALQRALQSGESKKEYLASLRGQFPEPRGDWRAPISPKAEGRRNPAGLKKDRIEAHTRFEVIAQTQWLSLLRCELLTGRQHQIRKHAAIAGHPIVGDRRYGDPKHARMIAHRLHFEGLALHAARLSVSYQGEQFSFTAPPPLAWETFGFGL